MSANSWLRNNIVKIDKSLVAELGLSDERQLTMKTLATMFQNLNLKVIVEGFEKLRPVNIQQRLKS